MKNIVKAQKYINYKALQKLYLSFFMSELDYQITANQRYRINGNPVIQLYSRDHSYHPLALK
jgi:hypothetical protein